MKYVIAAAIVVIIVIPLGYGSWKLSRWWNYKMSYQSMVDTQINKVTLPLEKRIAALEYEINVLRTNK